MAQPMMHLLIADRIYRERPDAIRSYGDFLLGSIAPDAIHMREGWTREQKRTAHYRYTSESTLSHFDTFFTRYATPENRDFVLGYLVHLLSDMIWYHTVRGPFKQRFLQAPACGLSLNEAYYADCEEIEASLFRTERARHIVEGIAESRAYTLAGMIDAESVAAWREKLIFDCRHKGKSPPHTAYISPRHVQDYIANCSRECRNYLELRRLFPR